MTFKEVLEHFGFEQNTKTMTFKEVLEHFGFEQNTTDWATEYRILVGTKYYYAFLSPVGDCAKWQGKLINCPKLLMNSLNDLMIQIIIES